MIISKTPFRISFFGGGTDYPSWIEEHGGAVVGTSINHYCYISCRFLPSTFKDKYRIVYSKIESTKTIHEIQHPVVNAVLNYLNFHDEKVEIYHDADLPARSGLGSSSAFTVAILSALLALKNLFLNRVELAKMAIYIEQELLKEIVGSQDQILTSHGGFNRIDFSKDGGISINPIFSSRFNELQDHLMLFYTGHSRLASDIAKSKVMNFKKNRAALHRLRAMVDESLDILQNKGEEIVSIGTLLNEAWQLKKNLSDKISNGEIDQIYALARQSGAIGGKLLGAGGGGFMLLFVCPENQRKVKQALSSIPKVRHVPFEFENHGSQLITCPEKELACYA